MVMWMIGGITSLYMFPLRVVCSCAHSGLSPAGCRARSCKHLGGTSPSCSSDCLHSRATRQPENSSLINNVIQLLSFVVMPVSPVPSSSLRRMRMPPQSSSTKSSTPTPTLSAECTFTSSVTTPTVALLLAHTSTPMARPTALPVTRLDM